MKKDFVPFLILPSDGSQPMAGSRTEVMVGAKTSIAFHPLMQTLAHPPTLPNSHGEPTVTFERDGDRVARIRIQCPCGNVLELACDYAE